MIRESRGLDRDITTHRRRINNYLITAKVGSGSSSHVYSAIDEATNREVAVKRIKIRDMIRAGNGVAQLERELHLIRRFNHPNILKLIEVLYTELKGEVYLILEYAEKGSVAGFLERGQRLSRDAVFGIMHQVIDALRYLHSLGFVHQDVKPGNILLDSSGRAFLADFGIGHSFASAGMVVGSPAYQAPEALDDYSEDESTDLSVDGPQKEDVWALGVTLYQMLFMKLPYYGGNLYEVVSDIRARPLEIPEGTEPEIAELLRGMLSIDPAARFGMDQLAENPLFAKKDRYEVPETPPPALKKGPVVAYSAQVCGEEFSFASIQVCTVRRFSVGPMAPPTRSLGPKARTVGVIRRVLPEGRRVWRS